MTANAMTGDRERCLSGGMDGYVSKPVSLDALLRAIGEVTVLSSSQHSSNPAKS
jgi:CheY-like chemotaxis protein